jgi:hypothetical protein
MIEIGQSRYYHYNRGLVWGSILRSLKVARLCSPSVTCSPHLHLFLGPLCCCAHSNTSFGPRSAVPGGEGGGLLSKVQLATGLGCVASSAISNSKSNLRVFLPAGSGAKIGHMVSRGYLYLCFSESSFPMFVTPDEKTERHCIDLMYCMGLQPTSVRMVRRFRDCFLVGGRSESPFFEVLRNLQLVSDIAGFSKPA